MHSGATGKHGARGHVQLTSSIVIPCHNYGRFLGEAIESALCQTRPAEEIIVVDDGSTDDSLDVAGRYADRPSVRVIAQDNRGAIAAYNAGIRASTSDTFVILSADDRLDARYLERTVPLLAAHPEAGYIYTAYRMFGTRYRVLPALPFSTKLLAIRPYISATALMRRTAFDQCGGFSTTMEGGHEDWDFFVTMAQRGWPGIPVPEVLFHYRKHSTTSRNALSFRRWLGVRARVYHRHRPLYRMPLALYLGLAVLNQNWLRARAAPRALVRRVGPDAHAQRSGRACLITGEPTVAHGRVAQQARAVAACLPVSSIALMDRLGAPGRGSIERHSNTEYRDFVLSRDHLRTYNGPLRKLRRASAAFASQARLAAAAVYQRAGLYHTHDGSTLPVAVLAASINRAALLYDAQEQSLPGGRKRLSRLGRAVIRILLWRVDVVIAADEETAAVMYQRFGVQSTVLGNPAGQPVEGARLLQLYRDYLANA